MTYQPEQQNNIQESFNLTLKGSSLEGLTVDMIELGVDGILKDGLLRDIPVMGTITNLIKVGANIQDYFFIKKLLSFLVPLKDVSIEERSKMIDEIDNSEKHRIKVGEKLLYIIDSCEDHEISERISLVFKYFIEGNISYEDFLKTSTVLKELNTINFNWFVQERKNYFFDIDNLRDMVGSGLFEINYDEIDVDISKADEYKLRIQKKDYEAEVSGGIDAKLSRTGEIILEIFCPSYNQWKNKK